MFSLYKIEDNLNFIQLRKLYQRQLAYKSLISIIIYQNKLDTISATRSGAKT